MISIRHAVCLAAGLFLAGGALESSFANAITVTNVSLQNATNGSAEIHFGLGWQNSWRSEWTDNGGATFVTNWDAAWVYAKCRVSGGPWLPVWFNTSGHAVPAGMNLSVAQNGGATNPGVFIHRSATGAGSVFLPDVKLSWNYAAGGLYGTNQVDIAVFATEMVYIPQGPFWLGSGSLSEVGSFETSTSRLPYLVAGEGAMTIGTNAGALYSPGGGYLGAGALVPGVVSNGFPKGYDAFYAMKHEISQGQYADFLNHVPGGGASRFPNQNGVNRHTLSFTGTNYVAAAPDRACNFFSWDDLCAFLSWAGLRPVTELEYEKLCRGPAAPIVDELAFADAPVYAAGAIAGDGSGTDVVATANANISGNAGISGPLRVGIFATATSTRPRSGAGYFGNMELSGNVWEQCVTLGDTRGRLFAGSHGDGSVIAPPDWPRISNGAGYGVRGGSWNDSGLFNHVSDRYYAAIAGGFFADRNSVVGGRGGRTAP